MTKYQMWLPADHLKQPELTAPVRKLFDQWVRMWFGECSVECSKSWDSVSDSEEYIAGELLLMERLPWHECNGLWIAAYDRLAIAEQMLDLNGEKIELRAADRAFLSKLAGSAVSDLEERVRQMVPKGASSARSDASCWRMKLDISQTPMVILECDEEWLIGIAKQQALVSRQSVQLDSRQNAIAHQEICLGASLAHMKISLEELESLGRGDVVIFDKLANAPVSLMVEGVRNDDATYALVEMDGRLMLKQWEGEMGVG